MRLTGAVLLLAAALPGAAAADGLEAAVGKALFEREWAPAPASTRTTDGLGPLYNARSCAACHPKGGRAGLELDGSGRPLRPGLVLRLPDHARLGRQLQTGSVPGLPAEGRVTVRYAEERVALAGGGAAVLRRPSYRVEAEEVGRFSPRLAPSLRGAGLLAAVPDEILIARADPEDRDGDGVRGRAGPGRFGLRAEHPSLRAQVAEALLRDLGMATPPRPFPAGDCTPAQARCRALPHGDREGRPGVELGEAILEAITAYVAALPPARPRSVPAGPALFGRLGCAACHAPSLPARTGRGLRSVAAYTDLLLHDLGPRLADPGGERLEEARLWRTAPLWGVGGASALLHDGRARGVEEAILWHGGEAEPARERYRALPPEERAALLTFLGGL